MNMINKIFHVSDIHIRNLKRHVEYRQVFDKLYKEIDERKDENSIIVVTGDIAHSKTEMSPELVDMISKFLTRLAELCDTIVIAGNHDLNANNSYRLDVLSPIIENLDIDNLYYYKETGVYTYGNIDFVLWNFTDEPENYIKASDIDSENVKIGLYHGPVNKATTDIGFQIFNNDVDVDDMNGFDMFMLGDIHSVQTLQEYSETVVTVDEEDLDMYLDKGWEIIEEYE